MRLVKCMALAAAFALLPAATAVKADPPMEQQTPTNSCRLILPPEIPVVVGREINIYFDNVVLVPQWRSLYFDVECARGVQQEERWTYTPGPADAGEYPLTLSVYDGDYRLLATAKSTIRVIPADAAADKEARLLIIGDSLTQASVYPEELLNLCRGAGNPRLTLLGTFHVNGASPENRHEGYGGWTFQHFLSRYVANPNPNNPIERSSPFVFLEEGKPTFDFPRYVREQLGGRAPDYVCIALGCNDIFGADTARLNKAVDNILADADRLIAGIRRANPRAKIGILPPMPPAATQDAFGANYGCGQTRWQYRRKLHRLQEQMLERYSGRKAANISLIPAFVNLDTEHNYPAGDAPVNARNTARCRRLGNGVHPAPEGYRQMADVIYSWLLATLAER